MSSGIAPPSMLAMMQPTNSPGTAAGVKNGSTVSISEIRTWTSLKLIGANSTVSTTYSAAITAACVMYRTFLSLIFSYLHGFD